ncbi:MAG: hypothetical protein ACRD0B_09885 [Acidimicrobiales bacterium]
MARVPIACSLTAGDAEERVAEWRQLLERHVSEVARTDRLARLRLAEGDGPLVAATDLARREKACCPFLELRLVIYPEAVWLEVEAPDYDAAVLDGLVDLARR